MYLICHMTSEDPHIEGSCKFIVGGSSRYVTNLINFVTIDIVIVEI